MKHLSCIQTLLLILLVLTSCSILPSSSGESVTSFDHSDTTEIPQPQITIPSTPQGSTSAVTPESSPPPAVTDVFYEQYPPLSKTGLQISDVPVGMTSDDFYALLEMRKNTYEERFFQLTVKKPLPILYYGFIDSDGQGVLVSLDFIEQRITHTESFHYPESFPTQTAFEQIETGTHLLDLIKEIGFPFASLSSGVMSVEYRTVEGKLYRLYLDNNTAQIISVSQTIID